MDAPTPVSPGNSAPGDLPDTADHASAEATGDDGLFALAHADARALDVLLDQAARHKCEADPGWGSAYLDLFAEFLRKCRMEERYLRPLRSISMRLVPFPAHQPAPVAGNAAEEEHANAAGQDLDEPHGDDVLADPDEPEADLAAPQDLDPADTDTAYALAAAEISYLILTGVTEQEAAQRLSRRVISLGHALPSRGGDPRGWMRLLTWRENLRTVKQPEALYDVYSAELERLRAEKTVQFAAPHNAPADCDSAEYEG